MYGENGKRVFIVGLSVLVLIALVSQGAEAVSLSFSPSGSTAGLGDPISVDVIISGLDSVDLGAFDFKVNYDSSILTFDSYALGNGLGDIGLGEAADWSLGNLGGGVLNLAELSFLADLSLQPDSFSLATLSFTGAGGGTSPLSFSDVTLSDALGDPLNALLQSGSATVAVASVPEPTTVLLLGSGLVGLAGFRRQFKK